MSVISLNNLEFYSHHGHFKEEQVVGANFIVDFFCVIDTTKAEKSDILEDTIDYVAIYNCIDKEMSKSSYLIEHVVRRIIVSILDRFKKIEYAEVTLAKLNPTMKGKMQSVSITLSSDEV